MRLDTDPYLDRYATRVRGLSASEIRALFSVVSRPEVVSFAGGMPAVDELDHDVVAEVAAHVLRTRGDVALQYGGGQGRAELRSALVEVMAEERVPAHADDLVVTVGGQQALELVAKCLLDPGDVVVAEGPTYVGALGAMSSHQGDVRHVPIDADGMQVDQLADLLVRLRREGRTVKYVYTVPTHQNPGGVSLSTARRHRLAELAEQHDLLIVEDNPYGLLDFAQQRRPSLRELVPERVIYVGTMSKILSPGLRVGWVAAPHPIRDRLILLREAADLCPSNTTQLIVERWLSTQPWREHVKTFRETYLTRATVMDEVLREALGDEGSWTRPTGGLFLWVSLPEGIDTSKMLAKAITHRVAYVPGRGFYADGSGSQQLRLCYSFERPERIRAGIARLGEVVTAELELVRAVYGAS